MAAGQIRARVQCTVDIPVGVWGGGNTDLDALAEQVRREGLEKVRKMIQAGQGRVVGEPRVTFIILTEEDQA